MSFNEKLQKLRKENKYSQEELADKLDVTRQSVSKWESGQTYPEMDKLLAICKIFNCSLEELTNDEVKEISLEKKSNVTSLIDSVLDFIAKTYRMLTSMKFGELLKCAIIMLIVGVTLALFYIPVRSIENSFYNMVYALGRPAMADFFSSLFNIIMGLGFGVLWLLLFTYIFKIGFLDKYEFVEKKEVLQTELLPSEKKVLESTKEVIVKKTVEPDYRIFRTLGAIVMFFVKVFSVMFGIPFLFLLLALFALFVINIYLMGQGIIFVSILLYIIFGVALTLLTLEFIINIIFNKKHHYKRMLLTFLVGTAGIGIASGVLVIELNAFTYHESLPVKFTPTTDKYEYNFNEQLKFFVYNSNVKYVVDNTLKNKIVVEVKYYKDYNNIHVYQGTNTYDIQSSGIDGTNYKNHIELWLKFLKEKTIFNHHKLQRAEVIIYGTESNLVKIQVNLKKYYEEEERYQNEISRYQEEINELNNRLWEYENEPDNCADEKETLKEKINELEAELAEYKERIKSLLE